MCQYNNQGMTQQQLKFIPTDHNAAGRQGVFEWTAEQLAGTTSRQCLSNTSANIQTPPNTHT